MALAGAWWVTGGLPGLPSGAVSVLAPTADVHPEAQPEAPTRPAAAPSDEIVALADAAHLSDEGRQLLYGTRPELLDATAFAGRCAGTAGAQPQPGGGAVGCYHQATDTIVLYAPSDPRLRAFVVETAAHEVLHAAWARLTADEQTRLVPLLEAEVASIPADDAIHQQIAGSIGAHSENRPTELFAYVGTQVWRDGGLHPQLEAVYSRVVADRSALVGVHTSWVALLDGMRADLEAGWQALAATEAGNAHARAQYDADVRSLEHYRQVYEAKAAEVAAMPAEHRRALRLSWQWWDGTDLPMASAEETLRTAAALLARDEIDLPAREVAITAAESTGAAERARLERLAADLEALQSQLDPVASRS